MDGHPPDPGRVLDALTAAIDELAALDPAVLGESDMVLAVLTQLSRLERVAALQAVAFDASPEWVDDGAQNSTSWITKRRRCPRRETRRRLRLGQAIQHMPLVDQAWAAGSIDQAHVELLAKARRPAVAEVFARDELSRVKVLETGQSWA